MIADEFSRHRLGGSARVVVLFVLSMALAVAETALTRMSKPKAQALAEKNGKRGRSCCRSSSTTSGSTRRCSSCCRAR